MIPRLNVARVVLGSLVTVGGVAACVAACSTSKAGAGSADGGSPDAAYSPGLPDAGPDGAVPYVNEAVLADNGHAVMTAPTNVTIATSDAGADASATSAATSVTFPSNDETKALKVGDVIASGTVLPDFYLGSITAIHTSGSSITFDLAPAALTDLFKTLKFSQFLPAESATDGTASDLHILGGSGSGSSGSTGQQSPGGKAKLSFGGVTSDLSGSHVNVGGGLVFQIDYSIFSGLNTLYLTAKGNLGATLAATETVTAKVTYTWPEQQWATVPLGVYTFFVGPVPVPIAWEVDFYDSATITATGGYSFSASINANVSIEEGVKYQDGELTPVDNEQFSMGYGPFTHQGFNASLDVKAEPIIARMYLKPYKFLGGPFIELAPFEEVSIKDNTLNGGEAQGYLGVDVSVGGTLKIFTKTIGEKSQQLAEKKFQVFDIKFPSACSSSSMLATSWCNEKALKSCVGTSGPANLPSCSNKSGVCSNVGQSSGPSDLDSICNTQALGACLCAQQMGSGSGSGSATGDGGDCFSQHCSPCTQSALSCTAPM